MADQGSFALTGVSADLQFSKDGPRMIASGGLFRARNAVDGDFTRVQLADSVDLDDAVTRRQLLAAGGAAAGSPNVYEGLVFYVDGMDPSSYSGSGPDVTDIQGNATAGTLTTATAGDGGFEFNGSSGDLSFTKDATLDNIWTGGGTVISFSRPQTDGESSDGRIVGTSGPGTGIDGWHFEYEAESADRMRLTFDLQMSGTNGRWDMDDIDGLRPVQNGGWSSVAVTFDDGDVANNPTMYLNGEGVSNTETLTPTGTPNSDAGNPIVIGNREADDRTFFGEIGVVLFFDRILTPVEIAIVHNAFGARYGIGLRGRPSDASGIPAADVEYAAGDWVGSAVSGRSGTMRVRGGKGTTSAGSNGGVLDLRGGDGFNRGGNFILLGGQGPGGQDACEVGAGDATGATTAGDLLCHGGDNVATGPSGDLEMRGGNCTTAGSGSDNAGDCYLCGGQQRNVGDPGNVYIITRGPTNTANDITGDIVISTTRSAIGSKSSNGGAGTDTGTISIATDGNGSTSGQTGDIDVVTGTVNDTTGNNPGDFNVVLGSITPSNGNATGGSMAVTCGNVGGGTNTVAGFFSVTAGDFEGTESSGVGGDCGLHAGNQTNVSATGRAGKVEFVGGDNAGTGDKGDVEARAYEGGAFQVRTQEGGGFEETGKRTRTLGTQVTVNIAATVTLATLGSLTVNGRDRKFKVYVTIHDSTTDADIRVSLIYQTAYRAGGSIALLTPNLTNSQVNGGASFIADLSIALATSGTDDIVLQVTNGGGVAYTLNVAAEWNAQEGGLAA